MKGFRFLSGIVIVALFVACAAFDSGDKTVTEVTPEGQLAASPTESPYQGFYTGKAALAENTCAAATIAEEISLDVQQAGERISVMTEDGTEGNADLEGNKVTILLQKETEGWFVELTFEEEKVSAVISVVEGEAQGRAGEACTSATVELAKGEKPEGWGQPKPEGESEKPVE